MRFGDERDWFFHKRFGMFVHWGIYSIDGFHEQEMARKPMSRIEYETYSSQFNPDEFDPDAWIDLAEEAGMEYLCFTTKHHDGFCMWDTKETDFNIMNTPYGKDILRMLSKACARRNMPLCLYYSCVDWHHPNYPNEGRHHELGGPEPGDQPNMEAYIEFVKKQIRELCTEYGDIYGIFWDMNVPEYQAPEINDMIRSLQPKAVINDRGYDEGDYGTPERDYQSEATCSIMRFERMTEACQSVGMTSWGFKRDEHFFSSKFLIKSIAEMLAKGANYLLNVGPSPDGRITEPYAAPLRNIGNWYKNVKEAFEDTLPCSEMIRNPDVLLTRKGNTVYAVFVGDPNGTSIILEPLTILPRKATLLNDQRNLPVRRDRGVLHWTQGLEYVRICDLPVEAFYDQVLVVKLEFDELPESLESDEQENKEQEWI